MKSIQAPPTGTSVSKGVVIGVGCGALCLFALCYGSLGPTLELMGAALRLSLPEWGSLMTGYAFGYLLIVLFGGALSDRFGKGRVLTVALLAMGGGMFVLAGSRTYAQALLGMGAVGGGGGLVEVAVSALASDASPRNRGVVLNLMHVVFALSAVSPLLIAWQVSTTGGWRNVYWAMGAGVLLATPIPLVLGWGASTTRERSGRSALATLVRRPRLWALVVGQTLYVSAEFGVASWAITYLVSTHGVTFDRAHGALSLFWVSLAVGRLVCTLLAGSLPLHILIIAMAGGATAWLAAILALPLGTVVWIALGLTGLFFAGMFATSLAYAGHTYPGHSGTAFSLVMAAGAAGALVGPWLMGVVAELSTIRLAFSFVAVAMFANVLIFVKLGPAVPDQRTVNLQAGPAA